MPRQLLKVSRSRHQYTLRLQMAISLDTRDTESLRRVGLALAAFSRSVLSDTGLQQLAAEFDQAAAAPAATQ